MSDVDFGQRVENAEAILALIEQIRVGRMSYSKVNYTGEVSVMVPVDPASFIRPTP